MNEQTLLHLWDDGFIYIAPAIQSELAAHPASTLLALVSGRAFTLEARELIAAVHRHRRRGAPVAVFRRG